MEVSYAEAAAIAAVPYRDPTVPEFSSDGEADGETVDQEGHNVSHDGITLRALQSAIELVVTSVIRDDAQAQGAAHTSMITDVCASRLRMRRKVRVRAAPSQCVRTFCASMARNACHLRTVLSCLVLTSLNPGGIAR